MLRRCGDARQPDFNRYGGRGIYVCRDWHNFEPFYEWATSNGYRDDLTIDRADNERGYSPENCRWVDRTVQNRNRRDNIRYDWKGSSKTISEIAESEGVSITMLRQRVQRRGWPLDVAVSLPAGNHIKGAMK